MSDRVQGVITRQGNDVSDLVNRYAEANGCDAVGLLAGLISESNLDEQAERDGAWPDVSFGLGQQTALYASVGDHSGSAANLQRCRDYYFQPENAIAEAARQYGAYYQQYGSYQEAWSRYNGGPGMAFANNPNAANIQRGWDAAQAYLAPDGVATYNPDQPAEIQISSWACSVRTATWMLKSIGGTQDAGALEDAMVAAGLVTPADGLEDPTGASLAGFLAAQSGLPTGHQFPVTWDDLQALPIGQQPFGLGGQAWDHWVGVRRWAFDMLALANPAPGWQGVRDALPEADFDRLGAFAAVWIALPAGGDALSAEERAELGRLRSTVASYENDTFQPLAETMDALLAQPPSKATLLSKIAEMRNSIRTNVGV